MKKRTIIMLVVTTMAFSACGKDDNRNIATENSVFDKSVTVEAEITSADKYKDGLESYYIENYFETDEDTKHEDFVNTPSLFGNDMAAIDQVCSNVAGTELSFKWGENEVLQENEEGNIILNRFTDYLDQNYKFTMVWETGAKFFDYTNRLYAASVCFQPETEGNENIANNIEGILLNSNIDYEGITIDGMDKSTIGEKYLHFIEDLTGREIYEDYVCIPVNSESGQMVNELLKENNMDASYIEGEEDYYYLRYNTAINGLRYSGDSFQYELSSDETASETAKIGSLNATTLSGLVEWPEEIWVTKEGLHSFFINSTRGAGKIYREKTECIDSEEVIAKALTCFDTQILKDNVVIYDVELEYVGDFGKDESGVIVPILTPAWYVEARQENGTGYRLVYNAYTGEAIYEGESF